MLKATVLIRVIALAGILASGCSSGDSVGAKPSSLSLSGAGNGCVDLKDGSTAVGSWCGTNITSFDVERVFTDPNGRYALLLLVDGKLLSSGQYAAWDTLDNFVLVGTTHPLDTTFSVESNGKKFSCGGKEQSLVCVPASG